MHTYCPTYIHYISWKYIPFHCGTLHSHCMTRHEMTYPLYYNYHIALQWNIYTYHKCTPRHTWRAWHTRQTSHALQRLHTLYEKKKTYTHTLHETTRHDTTLHYSTFPCTYVQTLHTYIPAYLHTYINTPSLHTMHALETSYIKPYHSIPSQTEIHCMKLRYVTLLCITFDCITYITLRIEDNQSIIEGSLEVKLPTKWTIGTAEVGRVREEKKRREKIREETRWEERKCRCAKR